MGQKNNAFIPLKIAVLTVSDSRTAADDSAGDYLVAALTDAGHVLADRALCPDNLFRIRAQVSDWIADEGVQVVLINGGTGFNEQNRVPEAVPYRALVNCSASSPLPKSRAPPCRAAHWPGWPIAP